MIYFHCFLHFLKNWKIQIFHILRNFNCSIHRYNYVQNKNQIYRLIVFTFKKSVKHAFADIVNTYLKSTQFVGKCFKYLFDCPGYTRTNPQRGFAYICFSWIWKQFFTVDLHLYEYVLQCCINYELSLGKKHRVMSLLVSFYFSRYQRTKTYAISKLSSSTTKMWTGNWIHWNSLKFISSGISLLCSNLSYYHIMNYLLYKIHKVFKAEGYIFFFNISVASKTDHTFLKIFLSRDLNY